MTRRRELEIHRRSLAEIREILDSMKTLAYMETRKLSRFLVAQRAVRESVEAAAADFLGFFPEVMPQAQAARRFYLLVGSERGFCADFNEKLLDTLPPDEDLGLLLCGQKLHIELERDPRVVEALEGATVAEDVDAVLNRLVARLASLQAEHGTIALYALYHDGIENSIATQQLLPPFQPCLRTPSQYSIEPMLTLAPQDLLLELTDHYLFAALNEILYTSLMAENHQRVTHLEGAVTHLDEEGEEMQRRSNALRQEEITEEIEVILLSAASLDGD
jgi:F-type H+-transporting ATPase subunit gamma